MIANFSIVPYVSVGPIHFGMVRARLHDLLGPPDRGKKSRTGNRMIDYWLSEDITIISSSAEGLVEEVNFGSSQTDANIEGYKIFQYPGPISYRELCLKDGNPRADVGFTVLFHLGLALDGFLATEQEQRIVTAFARGVWDENDNDLKPIQIS